MSRQTGLPRVATLQGWLDSVRRFWDELPDVPVSVVEEITAVVRSHPQEMAENVVDSAHFRYVHGTPDIPDKTFTFEEHIMRAYQGLTFTTPISLCPLLRYTNAEASAIQVLPYLQ